MSFGQIFAGIGSMFGSPHCAFCGAELNGQPHFCPPRPLWTIPIQIVPPLTEAEVRRIVREELERSKEEK